MILPREIRLHIVSNWIKFGISASVWATNPPTPPLKQQKSTNNTLELKMG